MTRSQGQGQGQGSKQTTGIQGLITPTMLPPRIVLMGEPGSGKTTFGRNAERPVFIPTERGADAFADLPQFPIPATWEKLIEHVRSVAQCGQFKTVVIDTMNEAVQLCAQHICTAYFGGDWGRHGYMNFGQGVQATAQEFRKLLAELDKCREDCMTVLLTAQMGNVTVFDVTQGEYSRTAPLIPQKVWDVVFPWCDLSLRLGVDLVLGAPPDGRFKKRITRQCDVRRLYCEVGRARSEKCRGGYEVPSIMDPSWASLMGLVGGVDDKVEEIKKLWYLLDSGEQEKTLTWLGVSSLDGLARAGAAKLGECLNKLRDRMASLDDVEEAERGEVG